MEEKPMTPLQITTLLSKTMHDVANRKITMRHALAVSRVAMTLVRTIEVSDLHARIQLLEQILKKKS